MANFGFTTPETVTTKSRKTKPLSAEKNPLTQISELSSRLTAQEQNTKELDSLIKLGWLVIILTALGIAIALFNLIIDFYSFKNENEKNVIYIIKRDFQGEYAFLDFK